MNKPVTKMKILILMTQVALLHRLHLLLLNNQSLCPERKNLNETNDSQLNFIFIECNQLIIGEVCADRLCDRTADKSEPDKADFCRSDV